MCIIANNIKQTHPKKKKADLCLVVCVTSKQFPTQNLPNSCCFVGKLWSNKDHSLTWNCDGEDEKYLHHGNDNDGNRDDEGEQKKWTCQESYTCDLKTGLDDYGQNLNGYKLTNNGSNYWRRAKLILSCKSSSSCYPNVVRLPTDAFSSLQEISLSFLSPFMLVPLTLS